MANKKGYLDGMYYYSAAMPKGMGSETVYNRDEAEIIGMVLSPKVTKNDVIKAQNLLIKLGYLDAGDNDEMLGPITMGAARRYQSNTSNDSIFDAIKDRIDSMFE